MRIWWRASPPAGWNCCAPSRSLRCCWCRSARAPAFAPRSPRAMRWAWARASSASSRRTRRHTSCRSGRAAVSPRRYRRCWPTAWRAAFPMESLAAMLECVDDVVAVSDAEVASAMRLYYSATHNLAEGAGAAPLAAALQLKDDPRFKGCKIGLPLTGANVDADLFHRVLQGDAPFNRD